MKRMKLVEQAATDTLPKLLRRNAQQHRQADRHAREGPRHLAVPTAGASATGMCATSRWGWRRPGFKRGDKLSVLGDNRAAALLGAAGRAGAGRHVRAALSGLDCERAGLRARPRRGVGGRGRGPGAGRQGPVRSPASCRTCACVVYDDPRGMSAYDASDPQVLRASWRRWALPSPRQHPGLLRARAGPGRAPPTSRADRLHLRAPPADRRARC